jgi:TetR/AcrR family transcriptional repressor of nem operon
MKKTVSSSETRKKLLDAAMHVMRLKGYAATTVDDVCREAKVTKGSFFHYFDTKEALAIAAADHFGAMATGLFAAAPYRSLEDPLDRLFGYVDLRIALLEGSLCDVSCLFGTFVQELYETHPAIRAAAERHMRGHVAELEKDLAAAKAKHAPHAPWTADGVAFHMQAVLQGSLILAKATLGTRVAAESLGHLRQYLELLLRPQNTNANSN